MNIIGSLLNFYVFFYIFLLLYVYGGKKMGLEIEKKFLIKYLPENLSEYECHTLIQGYLNTSPVVRVRKEDNLYYLTYKGSGLLSREEYNLPLNEEAFLHLLSKADGNVISKCRYKIPYAYEDKIFTIELDVFDAPFEPLIIAEVEFDSEDDANSFITPEWFDKDVTFDPAYHNSNLSKKQF